VGGLRQDLEVTGRCQQHAALLEAFFDEREQVVLGVARLRKRDARFDHRFRDAERRVQAEGVPPMFTLRPALRDLERRGLSEHLAPMTAAADRANAAISAQLDAPGSVSAAQLGWSGAFAAMALLVHADDLPELRRTAIEGLAARVVTGEVDARRFAHLADRAAAMEGRPQVYGTLFVPVDGTPRSVWPMAGESEIDEARRTIGLPPLQEDRRRYECGAQPGPFLIPSTRRELAGLNGRLSVAYVRHGRWTRRLLEPTALRNRLRSSVRRS
jgi:hypothetical protein